MSRSQLILVAVTLITVALVLHVSLCEWVHKAAAWSGLPLLAYEHDDGSGYTGILAQYGSNAINTSTTSRVSHLFLGIILPLLLVATAVWLLLGWPRHSRIQRGRCPDCGYDLRGAAGQVKALCPECGWKKSSS